VQPPITATPTPSSANASYPEYVESTKWYSLDGFSDLDEVLYEQLDIGRPPLQGRAVAAPDPPTVQPTTAIPVDPRILSERTDLERRRREVEERASPAGSGQFTETEFWRGLIFKELTRYNFGLPIVRDGALVGSDKEQGVWWTARA
jgi:hypothetical protein